MASILQLCALVTLTVSFICTTTTECKMNMGYLMKPLHTTRTRRCFAQHNPVPMNPLPYNNLYAYVIRVGQPTLSRIVRLVPANLQNDLGWFSSLLTHPSKAVAHPGEMLWDWYTCSPVLLTFPDLLVGFGKFNLSSPIWQLNEFRNINNRLWRPFLRYILENNPAQNKKSWTRPLISSVIVECLRLFVHRVVQLLFPAQ